MSLILCVSEADIWASLAAHPGARQFPREQPRAHPASARHLQPLLCSPHTPGWTLGVAPTPQPAGSLLTLLCPFLPLETIIPPPPDRPCTSRPSGHASSVDWVRRTSTCLCTSRPTGSDSPSTVTPASAKPAHTPPLGRTAPRLHRAQGMIRVSALGSLKIHLKDPEGQGQHLAHTETSS